MKILICPLNWGLGHATRSVPIINKLLNEQHEIIIAADGYPLTFLRQSFPTLRFIELPSYPIYYSAGKSQVGVVLKSIPGVLFGIYKEHRWLKQFIKNEKINLVISDNRFGLWNKKIKSVYITHQLMVKMPFYLTMFEPILWFIHNCIIKKYDECRIPDFDDSTSNLSGDLSHKYPLPPNSNFIGPQSRFNNMKTSTTNNEYKVLAIISGVEPQRTIFEDSILKRYKNKPFKTLIITGQPGDKPELINTGNVTVLTHLEDNAFIAVVQGVEKIIARSGYSTIMDLYTLDCLGKAELLPTPGQTEQEYLYQHLLNKNFIPNNNQNHGT